MNTTSTGRATIETNSKRQAMATPMQYLDKAMTRLRDLGLVPEKTEEAPIVALLNRVSDLDNDKVVAIARTLSPSVAVQPGRARASRVDAARRALREDHRRLQQHSRRREEHGRAGRGRPHRHVRAPRERLAEGHARRHRGPLRQDQEGLSRRRQGFEGPDRARAAHPAGVSRFPRRAEGIRGARAASAEGRRRRARSRASEAQEPPSRPSRRLPGDDLVARAKLELKRDEELRTCSTPRTAIRSARTSRTT